MVSNRRLSLPSAPSDVSLTVAVVVVGDDDPVVKEDIVDSGDGYSSLRFGLRDDVPAVVVVEEAGEDSVS